MDQQSSKKEPQQSFRGLYKNVKISVWTLDIVILGGIVLMIVLILFGVANNGYTVTFDSKGGTDVPPQAKMYGDLLDPVEPPTREGYTFAGWYKDEAYMYEWNMETFQVGQSTTLYARWEKLEP